MTNINVLKEQYPSGTRICLDYMSEDIHPIRPGTKGTVKLVDDIGTVHCNFDNGRSLGLIPGEDGFHIIEETREEILESIDENKDAFWIFPDQQEVYEMYFNPDSAEGGQFVLNVYSFNLLLEAEDEMYEDDFFPYLEERGRQWLVDVTSELDVVREAAMEFNRPAHYCGCNKTTMKALLQIVHEAMDNKKKEE